VRLRYKGLRPFTLHVRDETYVLNEGDIVEVDPWKIRSKRLSLFDVLVDDDEVLTEKEKKLLKVLKLLKER